MNVQGIIANVVDRCGGSLIEELPVDIPTLHVLNTMERRGLQLAQTFKGSFGIKYCEIWTQKNGELSAGSQFINRPQYVRYRRNFGEKWQILDVVNDIEELTYAENNGHHAVFFSRIKPLRYHLSFAPECLHVEIWGQHFSNKFTNLSQVPRLPEEFSQMVACEAALPTLDDLLLLPNAARYGAFFSARKATFYDERAEHARMWSKFLAQDQNRNIESRRAPFDIFDSFEDALEIYFE